MTTVKSLIPKLPIKAIPRSAHWTCFLAAAAALQLTACGGAGDAAPGVAAVSGAARNLIVMQKQEPDSTDCDSQVNDTPEKLLGCMTLPAVRAHQTALAEIADANGGTRMTGTPGHEASVDYARKVLEDAGYKVTVQSFNFPVSIGADSSLMEPGLPAAKPIPHKTLNYSSSGDVTATVSRLQGMTGCKASDFADFPKGNIALIRRGACGLTDKVINAVAAGAAAVVIYNPAGEALEETILSDAPKGIPAVMIGKAVGESLLQRTYEESAVQLQLKVKTESIMKTSYNVLAESVSGDSTHVTVVGAHLDSVAESGGSNDNGSGVAAVLETARQMARVTPVNKLRFALWGANEQGMFGSRHYTQSLDAAEKASIGMYLNFDMIGSPNFIFYVYGGDGSAGPKAISNIQASAQMVNVFTDFYAKRRIPYRRFNAQAWSDHQSFADIGIPFAGIFTGAEEIKSQEDVAIWGGKPGIASDSCNHLACDDLSNYDEYALAINVDAVAYSTLYFAMNKVAK